MNQISPLNRALCAALGVKVFEHKAMCRDGTFVQPHIKDAKGDPHPVPDFDNDVDLSLEFAPITIQVVRRWSFADEAWLYVFQDVRTGEYFSEGRDKLEPVAAAKALLGYLQLEAVRA